MIKEQIKVLIVEDNVNDAQLIQYHINKIVETPNIVSVNTFNDFKDNLVLFNPDIIISDYKMNGFNGMDVLRYTKTHSNVSNFIFITGTIYDEELAAETILNGATGYILKKHMRILSTKLLPYFKKAIENRKISRLPPGHEEMFESMKAFIESAKRDNQAHIESYQQIKDALDKIKSLNKDA